MKKVFLILILIQFISCNSENAPDCFQTTGKIITKEIVVEPFTTIVVQEKVEMIIKEGPTQKIVIETGENLMPEIKVTVTKGELLLENFNSCKIVRDYGLTKVYVTAPNITKIRNSSEQAIRSEGILTYPELYLMSVGNKSLFSSLGDFYITLDNTSLRVWSNGISNLYIDGKTEDLNLIFSDGDTRFEGKNLIADNINVRQVSTNDIIINPQLSLKGTIKSIGDVISYNKPPIVEVEELYTGKLIFK